MEGGDTKIKPVHLVWKVFCVHPQVISHNKNRLLRKVETLKKKKKTKRRSWNLHLPLFYFCLKWKQHHLPCALQFTKCFNIYSVFIYSVKFLWDFTDDVWVSEAEGSSPHLSFHEQWRWSAHLGLQTPLHCTTSRACQLGFMCADKAQMN